MSGTPVRIPKPLKKKLARKSPKMQEAILACITQLRQDWRSPGLASKLGGTDTYHVKASRGDRVTFYWDGDTIVIENHCNHDILKQRR